ncbi:hypothetical protein M0802_012681 [Mischocyttarus mexicanus]|nr:hypothetical protein M0802_012681 [Mischocyttarus mexicanus]
MEDSVAVNGVVDVNGVNDNTVTSDRIYYELDGEGDADSSTTQGHNPDQRGRGGGECGGGGVVVVVVKKKCREENSWMRSM